MKLVSEDPAKVKHTVNKLSLKQMVADTISETSRFKILFVNKL